MHAHGESLNRVAASATTHCLTGCAIGEVLGFVIEPRSAGETSRRLRLPSSASLQSPKCSDRLLANRMRRNVVNLQARRSQKQGAVEFAQSDA
jgi:hypothetical protein